MNNPTSPPIANIVFDFGAVLFKWEPARLVASHFPEQASSAQSALQLAHAMFHHADWLAFDSGTMAQDDVATRMAERLALPLATVRQMVSSIADHLTPLPGTLAVLTRLHQARSAGGEGPRLYYLSNMSQPFARMLESRYEFLSWFDGGVFSGDVQLIKPEPAIYAHLENQYGLQPAQTLFIDDLAGNIEAARARGWQGVRFESATQLVKDLQARGIRAG